MPLPYSPPGYATVNAFLITRDADGLLRFLADVFDAIDRPDARTMDDDGLLLHAEVQVGGSTVMVAERKPGWPFTPGLLQVYVDDVAAVLSRAEAGGARVVTVPTEFYGDTFSRFIDPWCNLWWVYSTQPAADDADWGEPDDAADSWEPTPELTYIHDTLLEAMPQLTDSSR